MTAPTFLRSLPDRRLGYADIADYAMIGDRFGAALVCRDGSIDWCCMPRFDSEPAFARILDQRNGGYFLVQPREVEAAARSYLPGANILETRFSSSHGEMTLLDFMAISRNDPDLRAMVRIVSVEKGRVDIQTIVRAGGLDEGPVELQRMQGVLKVGALSLFDGDFLSADGATAEALWTLEAGESRAFILSVGETQVSDALSRCGHLHALAETLLADTSAYWRGWADCVEYEGRYRSTVVRGILTLKMMMFEPTGAMIAAPTCSLPEEIGGVRNWDYRYCWPRDASFAFYALAKLGLTEDAERFFRFFRDICQIQQPPIPPLFSIDGAMAGDERHANGFEGYKQSAPVNVGNEAAGQHQLDVYGQIVDLAYLHNRLGNAAAADIESLVAGYANFIAQHWRDPDSGLWEPRLPPRRHVHSAIMCWTTLDRAIKMLGERPHWARARQDILDEVSAAGVNARNGGLTQVFGGDEPDAATLLAAVVGMPLGGEIISRTCDAVIRDLGAGPLVYRYRNSDGLPGQEGTFLVCAFWLIDALLIVGRGDEAKERLEALLRMSNDVGLFSEQMSEEGDFLGNFPQAFTHLGLLQSILMLELFEERGLEALQGTYADRAAYFAKT